MVQKRSSIRKSRDSDLVALKQWLHSEEVKGIPGNFFCNWRIIAEAHSRGDLIVFFDAQAQIPIAFQLGGLLTPGILQVKSEHRNIGIGRKIVDYLEKKAYKNGSDILRIECKPSTSIPFWKKMGFMVLEDGCNAFKILPRQLTPPNDASPVGIKISFYPESVKWKPETQPVEIHNLLGYQAEGKIWLKERLSFYPYQYADIRDPVVDIQVAGASIYRDKLKYRESRDMGITYCQNGWFLEVLELHAAG